MELTVNVNENIGYITLVGQLWQKDDLNMIDEAIDRLLQSKVSHIVLDMDRLGFINSAGLGLLARTHTTITEYGGKFIISKPHSSVLEVIEVSGFDLFMTIVQTQEELETALR